MPQPLLHYSAANKISMTINGLLFPAITMYQTHSLNPDSGNSGTMSIELVIPLYLYSKMEENQI